MLDSQFKKIKLSSLAGLFLALLILPGCISIKGSNSNKTGPGPMGFFVSNDSGVSWQQKVALLNTEGKPLTISGININKIVVDPNESNTLYLATNSGLFLSTNAAAEWQQVSSFGAKLINDVAIDYFNKCNIFVATGQSVFLSHDCSRTYAEIYFDKTRPNLQITTIRTDHYNKEYLYSANNLGEVLKSTDSGKTWQIIKKVNNPVKTILIDKDDSRIVYVATETAGIFKTSDGGLTWSDKDKETNLNTALSKFQNWNVFYDLVQDLTKRDTFIWVCKYGLLKTIDGGVSWQKINLITPTVDAKILSIAIDPADDNKLYYGIESSFYTTTDGGQTWSTSKSPTVGLIKSMAIPKDNPSLIYLGTNIKTNK